MVKSVLKKTNYFVFSMLLFALGITILIGRVPLFKSAVNLILMIMILSSIKELFEVIFQKNNSEKNKIYNHLTNFIFVLLLFIYQDISIAIVPMVFGLYAITNGVVKMVSYILLRLDHVKNRLPTLFTSLFLLIIGILMFFAPLFHLEDVLLILGIYCLALGVTYFTDFLDEVKPDRKHLFDRKIRVTLPAIIDAFIPYNVMNRINHMFNTKKDEVIILEEKKSEKKPDMEIFIHVSKAGNGKFGHADMYFDGKLISYGGYDKDNRIFHEGIGSGVLFITTKEKYIPFCIQHSKKTLFGFGFKLTEKQKTQIREKLNDVENNLIPWEPSLLADQKAGKEIHLEEYEDYANSLYLATHAKFYKFKSGRFRSFFVLGTNCVAWMDSIIGPAGIDLLKLNGIITPGTYYDYLNNEFMKKGSHVISKTIYNERYLERKKSQTKYILFEYPNCNTCKKAKMWLDTHSIAYEVRNIILNPPTMAEIKTWVTKYSILVTQLIHTRGLYYKQMNLKEKIKKMSFEEQLKILSSNGVLVKRPILIGKQQIRIGFKETEWEDLIK